MTIRFPYSRPDVTDADVDAIVAAARSQFLTQGPRVADFEAALAQRFTGRDAIVVNSGTAALHLIYLALGLGPDAGLLTSPLTFLATANAARMCGAPVAFADVDPITGLVTPQTIAAALQQATVPIKVITVVHLGGRVCDMEGIAAVAEAHGCKVVEDACHAPGAWTAATRTGSHPVGACSHSAAAAFSFHAIKHVSMGEGGALLTNDPELAARARTLRSHGMLRNPADWQSPPEENAPWYYEMHEVGWNYRADEIACALGLSQFRRLDNALEARSRQVALYDRLLADIPFLTRPSVPQDQRTHAWHLYSVAIDFARVGKSRSEVMTQLAERGIGTQVHYIPLVHQPYYRPMASGGFPGVEAYYRATLSIPLYTSLSADDQNQIAESIRAVLGGGSAQST